MMRFIRFIVKLAIFLTLCILAARWYFPLPSLDGRIESTAIVASDETALGRSLGPLVVAHPGTSGMYALPDGPVSLSTRVVMANAAESSIDAQYYIWEKDATGLVLLDALHRAAERGVRVRLLVDDNGTPGLDPELASLNAMENFEVRFFNPFILRSPRVASYLFDFPRLNRRMHNKSFTVDGIVTIVGGRNIGNVYFAYGLDSEYYDLDVLGVGEIAAEVATNFDKFWASDSSYPADLIITSELDGLAMLTDGVSAANADPNTVGYRKIIDETKIVKSLIDQTLKLDWAKVTMVSDEPTKGLAQNKKSELMINRLIAILGDPVESIDLISAYFIPGDILTRYLSRNAENGVAVRVLTNSQEATDVLPVHAGYLLYRDELLDAGVGVYELKSQQEKQSLVSKFGLFGASTTSLHAKTFALDDQRIFIGSFNFDPRSAELNTEMGFLIESPAMANILTRFLNDKIDVIAYHVIRTEDDGTAWIETDTAGNVERHTTEPMTTRFTRGIVTFIGWLPVIWIL